MTNNKDYLSQEEIDALLRQSAEGEAEAQNTALRVDEFLTSLEQDALGEIGNITFGSAATALSTLLGKKVDITTPRVSVVFRKDLEKEFPKPHVAVHVKYVEGFQGINLLVIQSKDAQVIADLMLGGEGTVLPEELNEIHISAVQEAMNQMMGSSATSMSTIFNRFVNISPPGIDILDLSKGEGAENLPEEEVFVKISFRLIIGDLIDSTLMQLLPVSFAREMVSILLGSGGQPPGNDTQTGHSEDYHASEQVTARQPVHEPVQGHAAPDQQTAQQPSVQNVQQPPVQPHYQQPPQSVPGYGAIPDRSVNVQPAQFASLSASSSMHSDDVNLNLLLDIPLKVTVELGRTKMLIKEILELSQGSIIELDKLAGEPVDILVNNKLIAKGEVVVIDENFGVRVMDIVNQWDRIQKIR